MSLDSRYKDFVDATSHLSPTVPWVAPVLRRLEEILSLQPNWDSYGAQPISLRSIQATLFLLDRVMLPDTPPPTICPSSPGSIQLEWHQGGIDLEVEYNGLGWTMFVETTGKEQEPVELESSFNPLREVLQKLGCQGRISARDREKGRQIEERLSAHIYGAGGHGGVVGDVLDTLGIRYTILDDARGSLPTELTGQIYHGIGDNSVRKILQTIRYPGAQWKICVALSARIAGDVEIGPGSQILNFAYIGPGTTIGAGTIINNGANVDHDCKIGSFVHIAPRSVLCGGVEVGDLSLVGAGVIIAPKVEIGAGCLIAMGSRIVTNLPDHTVVTMSGRIIQNSRRII